MEAMHETSTQSPKQKLSSRWLDVALMLSAAGLLLSIVVLGSRADAFAPPFAKASGGAGGMVTRVGDYELLTADVGAEDVLFVLDQRSEEVCVYRTDQQQAVQLLQRLNLPRTFAEARAKSQGRTSP